MQALLLEQKSRADGLDLQNKSNVDEINALKAGREDDKIALERLKIQLDEEKEKTLELGAEVLTLLNQKEVLEKDIEKVSGVAATFTVGCLATEYYVFVVAAAAVAAAAAACKLLRS